jgi:F-type H+-transporting ATPase subunit b
MPQFWPSDFAPQLVWLAISFVIMYLLMAKVALPRVAEALETRQDRIAHDLDQAEQLKQQADQVIADYEAALAAARAEAQETVAKANAEAQAEAERRSAEMAERLQSQASEAAKRIDAAKQQALAELKDVAVDLAQTVAERLIGNAAPQDRMQQAVDTAMRERG